MLINVRYDGFLDNCLVNSTLSGYRLDNSDGSPSLQHTTTSWYSSLREISSKGTYLVEVNAVDNVSFYRVDFATYTLSPVGTFTVGSTYSPYLVHWASDTDVFIGYSAVGSSTEVYQYTFSAGVFVQQQSISYNYELVQIVSNAINSTSFLINVLQIDPSGGYVIDTTQVSVLLPNKK